MYIEEGNKNMCKIVCKKHYFESPSGSFSYLNSIFRKSHNFRDRTQNIANKRKVMHNFLFNKLVRWYAKVSFSNKRVKFANKRQTLARYNAIFRWTKIDHSISHRCLVSYGIHLGNASCSLFIRTKYSFSHIELGTVCLV